MSPVKNAVEFCHLVENALAWTPADTERQPRWKSVVIMAGRVKKKVATNPDLYSWANLTLTVEWMARRWRSFGRASVSPMGVFAFVPAAVDHAAVDEAVDELAGQVFDALTVSMLAGEQDWVDRLARARGPVREEVLGQWRGRHG